MIVFPSNPTVGQTYDVGDRTFRFNGKGWVVSGLPGGVVTQTTGQSIVDVMSQKAVTDALGEQKSDSDITSTQDLPSLDLLSGATQKDVNAAQDELNLGIERGIAFNGNDVIISRDYYSAPTNITIITARGASLVERSTDNINFAIATPPFTVSGDIYWRITHNEENVFLEIKGKRL